MVRSHRAKSARRSAAKGSGTSYTAQGRAPQCRSLSCNNTTWNPSGMCHLHEDGGLGDISPAPSLAEAPKLSNNRDAPLRPNRPAEKAYATSMSSGRAGRFATDSPLTDEERNFTWVADKDIPDEVSTGEDELIFHNITVNRDNHSVSADYKHKSGAAGNLKVFGICQYKGFVMTERPPATPEVYGYDGDHGHDAVSDLLQNIATSNEEDPYSL